MIHFLKFLLPFTLVFGFLQHYIVTKIFNKIDFLYKTFDIYLFNILVAIVLFTILLVINKKSPLKTGFAFMGANLVKMFLVVLFLIPLIQSDTISDKAFDMLTVIIPYFLFLIFETVFAVQLINQK